MERILQPPINSFWKDLQDMYHVSELVYPPLKPVWPCLCEFLVQQRDETIGWRGGGRRHGQFSLGWEWLGHHLSKATVLSFYLRPPRLSADNKWNIACDLAAIRSQPLPKVSPEKTQDVKNRISVPDNWGTYQRKDFSEPRFLYLPIQSKALKSLTWDICFFP